MVFYAYLGYPVVLFILAKLFMRKVGKGSVHLDVSIVLAVKNEEKNIRRRIDNLLSQTYSGGDVEIIVVCDGSSDTTQDIAKLCSEEASERANSGCPSIKVINYSPSKGKPHALNLGIKEASGEIIVFADARQEFDQRAIAEIVGNFSDPSIGCVSGELMFYGKSDSRIQQEMGIYWTYEKYVRKLESSIHSLPGATGAIYAIRKSLFVPLPEGLLLDDVFTPMNIVCKGYRAILDEKAIAYDTPSKDFATEKRRKIRTLLGNWQLLEIMPAILNPLKDPIWFQYLSHKIIGRLIVPYCFILYVAASLFIAGWFYKFVFFSTIGLFLLPLFKINVIKIKSLERIGNASLAILSLNYFSLISFWFFLTRKKGVW